MQNGEQILKDTYDRAAKLNGPSNYQPEAVMHNGVEGSP